MARIAGVDLPREKRLEFALAYIHGVGRSAAKKICSEAGVDVTKKIAELSDHEVARLREVIDRSHQVEGDLKREVQLNIRRLIETGAYRGTRHRRGLPTRGQRSRSNARTRKGPKRTVAGKKKVAAKT